MGRWEGEGTVDKGVKAGKWVLLEVETVGIGRVGRILKAILWTQPCNQ
jgi:hypothetical protein